METQYEECIICKRRTIHDFGHCRSCLERTGRERLRKTEVVCKYGGDSGVGWTWAYYFVALLIITVAVYYVVNGQWSAPQLPNR